MLWSLMGSFAPLVSKESSTAAQERYDWMKYQDFHLGRMNIYIVMLKKANNAGNEGRVASVVSGFCINHTVVCEFMTALLKHTSLTHSALTHPYVKALLPRTALWVPSTSHCTPHLATPEHFGCFWIRNDWLGLLKPEYGFPEVSNL